MAYLGAQPNKTLTKTTSQSFNGTGSATVFTLNRAVNTEEELEVFVENVQQEPGSGKSYTASGTTLTFDEAPPSGTGNIYVIYRGQAEVTTRLEHDANAALSATTGTFSGDLTVDTDTLYVDSTNDRVGIGDSAPVTPLTIATTNKLGSTFTGTTNGEGLTVTQTDYTSGNYISLVEAAYDDSNDVNPNVRIGAMFDGGGSHLAFGTSNNYGSGITNTAMFIDSVGKVGIGDASPGNVLDVYGNDAGNYLVSVHNDGNNTNRYGIAISCGSDTGSGTNYLMGFRDGDHNSVGSITFSGSTTSFNESSDHRLKENVADMTGAIARVKQLAPKRFNFIRHPDTTVDGFLAHEAQTVVPEAVTGTHNEVDDDGNAVMQGIDQSKLVPLLTGALKEAIAKIEALETKVAALEGN